MITTLIIIAIYLLIGIGLASILRRLDLIRENDNSMLTGAVVLFWAILCVLGLLYVGFSAVHKIVSFIARK